MCMHTSREFSQMKRLDIREITIMVNTDFLSRLSEQKQVERIHLSGFGFLSLQSLSSSVRILDISF